MKIFAIVGAILVTIVLAFFALSSPSTTTDSGTPIPQQQSISVIQSDIKAGAEFLDVRTIEEYNEGYIEGATIFPLITMQAGSLPTFPKDTKTYIYCRSGNRSAQAKVLLEKSGFTNIIDLGGIDEVIALGGKVVN